MLTKLCKDKKLICVAGFLTVFVFLSCLFTLYRFAESRALERYDDFVQVQIARRLQEVISSRVAFLTTLANYFKTNDIVDEKTYALHAAKFSEHLPEFYAINWIDPEGVIRWVYPEERNKDAKDKNLLKREELATYLLKAKEERQYVLSHVVKLYQGPRGFTFYYPIFQNKFKGWLNGVFTYEDILREFIIQNDFDQFNILIQDLETNYSTFEFGEVNKSSVQPFEFNVLNQKFAIYIEPKKNFLDYSQNITTVLIYLSSLIVSLILTYFIYKISTQNDLLERMNAKLRLSNSIVGVLTHDFSNQILIVENNINKLRLNPNDESVLQKLSKILKNQTDIIRKVNELRKKDYEQTDFKLAKTNVIEQIKASLETFESKILDKKILVNFRFDSTDLSIMTDSIYFQNNVLNNIISNAIKFSHEKGKIEIYAFKNLSKVVIEVRDYGVGIPRDRLKDIKSFERITSTKGTLGEEGTGFGFMQVKTFVEIFGGTFDIQSGTVEVSQGTLAILSFPIA